jgi:hypothetical protein
VNSVARLEAHLNCKLPIALKRLYTRWDAGDETLDDEDVLKQPMELMYVDDVIRKAEELRLFLGNDVCPFFKSDNGEYMVMYVSGALERKLFYLDHDGGDSPIAYPTVASFLKIKAKSSTLEGYEFVSDYFVDSKRRGFNRKSKRDVQHDLSVKMALESEVHFEDNDRGWKALTSASNLIQLEAGGTLAFTRRALYDDWVSLREHACVIIGAYRHMECIPDLEQLLGDSFSSVAELARATLKELRRP